MFVAIDNIDMDVFKVEEWIKTNRDANGGVISPEFAMEILTKTNHFAHIKKVLKNITKACLDENGELVADKVLAYKEFILSAVDRREESPQAMAVLQELAETGGFKDEFDKTNDKVKIYELKDCENVNVETVRFEEQLKSLANAGKRVFYDADKLDMSYCNLGFIKNVKFREGATAGIQGAYMLPKELDLSMCSKVDFIDCNFEGVEKLKFREDTCVNLWGSYHLPQDLDVSMCACVFLSECDLYGINLKFKEGTEVHLRKAMHLPKDLDVSMCSIVDLSGCNLLGINLKFKEGADVDLCRATNLSKELDFSMCSKVDLMGCNLEGIELKFREGTEVHLRKATHLPKELDLSMCSQVNLAECDLTGVEKIKFKDRKQKREFMKEAKNFSGEVEYEETTIGKIGKVFNKEM